MPDDQIAKILDKLDALNRAIAKLEAIIDNDHHDEDIRELKSRVSELRNKHSNDISDIYSLLRSHDKEYHSSSSVRNNWVGIAVIGCTIVTLLVPFISKWLEK